MVITTFGERARFFLMPMERFKALARTYPAGAPVSQTQSWEISGHRISSGILDEFEIEVSRDSKELDPAVLRPADTGNMSNWG
jgi:hypothetical protein